MSLRKIVAAMLVLAFLTVSSLVFAKPVFSSATDAPPVEWQKILSRGNGTSANCIAQAPDCGFVVAGEGNYKSRTPGFIVKLDSSGNMQWNKSYTQVNFYAVKLTQDGGYAFLGYSFSGDAMGYLLLKTDKNGNMQWKRLFSDVHFASMDITRDSGYILAGSKKGDFWLSKTNSFGILEWIRTSKVEALNQVSSVINTNDGGYAVAGKINNSITGKYDFWLVKTDGKGSQQWTRNFGGQNGDSIANSIIQTGDGDYVLIGDTSTFGLGNFDAWIIKTDSLGNMLWNKTYGGTGEPPIFYGESNPNLIKGSKGKGNDHAYSIIQTSDGGFAFVGTSPFSEDYGRTLVWLVKTDVSGNAQWNVTFGGNYIESQGNSLIETSDGALAIAAFQQESGFPWIGNYYVIKTEPSLPPPTPAPTPTLSPSPEPESFPVAPVTAAFIAGVAVGAVGLLVYFKKRKHARTNKHSEKAQSPS
jgi:hypothetical protein